MDYLKDPAEIYARSFATVRAEAAIDGLDEGMAGLAVRLVHACGMPDIVADLTCSERAADAGREALRAGAPVICDCEMVRAGIITARLPASNDLLCTLNDPRTPERARSLGTTRSAAAVDLWDDRLAGAVVAIGNAPTALFRLLERLDAGAPRPALILAFPVGFVGAAESKAELAANPRGIPFVALRGRRGGSALAAAAVNALCAESEP
jgi:precorrin-8X/cobalt-precorrin-8 methylmutase